MACQTTERERETLAFRGVGGLLRVIGIAVTVGSIVVFRFLRRGEQTCGHVRRFVGRQAKRRHATHRSPLRIVRLRFDVRFGQPLDKPIGVQVAYQPVECGRIERRT